MAKVINSAYLEPVNKALGIAGAGDSQTELLDGSVDQVLDVGQVARRGGTLAGTEGIFRCVLRNIHAGAGDVSVSWQPYLAGAVDAAAPVAPFPPVIPDTLDFWLIGASIEFSGVGNFEFGVVRITNIQQGFGIDSAGNALVNTSVLTVAYWNTSVRVLTPFFAATSSRLPYKVLNLRIPRKGAIASPFIVFNSQADGVADVDLVMLCGLFPVALGQDIAQ